MTEAFSSEPGSTRGPVMDQGPAGPLQDLWPQVAEHAGKRAEAGITLLVARSGDGRWKRVASWREPAIALPGTVLDPVETLAEECLGHNGALRRSAGEDGTGDPSVWLLGARLNLPGASHEAVLLAAGRYAGEQAAAAAAQQLQGGHSGKV